MWKPYQKILIRLAALVLNITGLAWLSTFFIYVDASHRSPFMLPFAAGALLLALGLYLLWLPAIILLIIINGLVLGLGVQELFINSGEPWTTAIILTVISATYLIFLGPRLGRCLRHKQTSAQ